MRYSVFFIRAYPVATRAACGLVALLFLGACGVGDETGDDVGDLRIRQGTLSPRLLMSGELVAAESIQLRVPQTPERRVQLQRLVEDGSEVKTGDVLAEFDNSSFVSNLDSSRSEVHRAEKALQQARADGAALLEETHLAVERARITLRKAELDAAVPEGLQSRLEHAEVGLALKRAGAEHAKSLDDLRSSQAGMESETRIRELELGRVRRRLEEAEAAIGALQLVAPRDGIAVLADNPRQGRRLQPGDTVWIGLSVVSLPDLSQLQVSAALSDVDDGLISTGQQVSCTVDAYPELEIEGRVVSIALFAEELRWGSLRRGFEVTIDLDHTPSDLPLVPGMSVRVDAPLKQYDGVLLVPRAALEITTDGARAHTFAGWQNVELGACDAVDCVLLDGLDVGTRLRAAKEDGA